MSVSKFITKFNANCLAKSNNSLIHSLFTLNIKMERRPDVRAARQARDTALLATIAGEPATFLCVFIKNNEIVI